MKQINKMKIVETYKKVLKIKIAKKTIWKLSLHATEICFVKKYFPLSVLDLKYVN